MDNWNFKLILLFTCCAALGLQAKSVQKSKQLPESILKPLKAIEKWGQYPLIIKRLKDESKDVRKRVKKLAEEGLEKIEKNSTNVVSTQRDHLRVREKLLTMLVDELSKST